MPLIVLALLASTAIASASGTAGYYRHPAMYRATVVFVAEGDLWKVDTAGGLATRLTSHPGDETYPVISPDGRTVAFVGRYEGAREIYTMPLTGGLPVRRSHGASRPVTSGFDSAGRLLYSSRHYSMLPNHQLIRLDLTREDGANVAEVIPLHQAAQGTYGDDGTLYFTRLAFQGSHTRRYKGGTAQNLWRFGPGDDEATPLTTDYTGTSKDAMFWSDRVYFVSDRDGTMNLWSMTPTGGDLEQLTEHSGWDVKQPYLYRGRIVYQLGADIHLYDIETDDDRKLPIVLDSDFDQTRENWVEKPMDYLTAAHISKSGDRVALTARGRVFVAPAGRGRLLEASHTEGVRYRDARFLPNGKRLLALSDESGEVELWTLAADGTGKSKQLTTDGDALRWEGIPGPEGRYVAHRDKKQRLFLYDLEDGSNDLIEKSMVSQLSELAWSPDGKWLAYVSVAGNMFNQIKLYSVESGDSTLVTNDRFEDHDPAFSSDGKWLYFFSDRNLKSIVRSPWGVYQPEPYLDKTTKLFALALEKGLRSPFRAPDELGDAEKKDDASDEDDEKESKKKTMPDEDDPGDGDDEEAEVAEVAEESGVEVDFDGIQARLIEIPLAPGNYRGLSVTEKGLFWLSRGTGSRKNDLVGAKISNDEKKLDVTTMASAIKSYELSGNGKKILIRKGKKLHIVDAKVKKAKLDGDNAVDLGGWALSITPREEWRQMFEESWRLTRDYFYDPGMHGVDWAEVRERHRPLVDRVTTRDELGDLLAQMSGELSALHMFVYGGDRRGAPDTISGASLGARLRRDPDAEGYRVEHIYLSDPDEPHRRSPLAREGVDIHEGDVIRTINGRDVLGVADIAELLRRQAGKQVRLLVKPGDGGDARDVIVEPISVSRERSLRYDEWDYTRRLEVEEKGEGELGYLHLRAMGGGNYTEWAKGFYPVFNRKGLIIDVRNNPGGNIDSWLIEKLLRKAWFGWTQRVGKAPNWNMQYAFRGHVVVLCNEKTSSDGEAFSDGVKRLDLGTVIGTRTWGGEIWLSSSNRLVDGGIATAAEFGVYGPEGDWLVEGHGVDPDIVVDNLPHETFLGRDAQLEAAIEFLQRKIESDPIPPLERPEFPNKSFDYP